MCMMTTGYLKDIVNRNLTEGEIIEETTEICKLFDPSYHSACMDSLNKQLEYFEPNGAMQKTNQEFCHSIQICSKPGPKWQQNYNNNEFLDRVIGAMEEQENNARRIREAAQNLKNNNNRRAPQNGFNNFFDKAINNLNDFLERGFHGGPRYY
ncbi:hypothetical protein TVAG_183780 [Trichomonas vaginalis G3]|uniref:Saposin B-type domain-containing protein n=1 Tax=Trichomonas vaginalis (strain ATCC PRA-98 / G3) TaxID=412133 RepID=A2D9B5_TRIV3|nr:saposin family [Trichomonas vaginalis G3]EAY23141.1 hypothetical protein TVAG_183780 [Trichomonas vaginalis G3]KAI5513792.1 saposin family [Trichomonas vaginalis G3]|eukprot:XP_001584127.1 hypothetical protein [Trichomonas vaginalis G3]